MNEAYAQVEKYFSHNYAIVVFTVVLCVAMVVAGVDVANIFISIITADAAFVLMRNDRIDRKALHAKLDELIHATKAARDEVARIEDKTEAEIEETRL